MNTALTSAVKAGTIAIDLQAVRFILLDAARRVDDGCQCAERGDQNGAIGAALGLDAMLNDAKALYEAAVALLARSGLDGAGVEQAGDLLDVGVQFAVVGYSDRSASTLFRSARRNFAKRRITCANSASSQ